MRSTLSIQGGTITKTFRSSRLFYKELASYLLLEEIGLAGVVTPKLLSYSEQTLTIVRTKIEGKELSDFWFDISREDSAAYHDAIAHLLYDISRRVQATSLTTLGCYERHLSWDAFLNDVLDKAARRARHLKDSDKRRTIFAAIRLVSSKRADISERCSITWLHRDLVQDNILTNGNSRNVKLIDFEHSLIGPSEFEFANEAFLGDRWAPVDNKYIYANRVKKLLCLKYGLRYNFDLDEVMAVIYGLEHFGYGSKVGTYGTQRCAKIIEEKLILMGLASSELHAAAEADIMTRD